MLNMIVFYRLYTIKPYLLAKDLLSAMGKRIPFKLLCAIWIKKRRHFRCNHIEGVGVLLRFFLKILFRSCIFPEDGL